MKVPNDELSNLICEFIFVSQYRPSNSAWDCAKTTPVLPAKTESKTDFKIMP